MKNIFRWHPVAFDVIWKETAEQLPEDIYERFSEKEIFIMVYEAVQVNISFVFWYAIDAS